MNKQDISVEEGVIAYLPDLTRFAYHLNGPGNRDWAEDLVQKTVVRALERKTQFQVGTNLGAWLFTVMRSLFISERRRAKVRRLHEESVRLSPPTTSPPNQYEMVLLRETMQAIRGLSEQDRGYIRDLAIHEQPQADAAKARGVPVGTVKSRLSRSRAKLRAELKLEEESPRRLSAA